LIFHPCEDRSAYSRFFYKKPELLKEQANVYDLKMPEKRSETEEGPRHLPMRLGKFLIDLNSPSHEISFRVFSAWMARKLYLKRFF
jgi:hypothetical protein